MVLSLSKKNLLFSFRTKMDAVAPTDQKAAAGTDYVTVTNGVVVMPDRQTSATINITILPVSHYHTVTITLSLSLNTHLHITLLTYHTLVPTIGQHS